MVVLVNAPITSEIERMEAAPFGTAMKQAVAATSSIQPRARVMLVQPNEAGRARRCHNTAPNCRASTIESCVLAASSIWRRRPCLSTLAEPVKRGLALVMRLITARKQHTPSSNTIGHETWAERQAEIQEGYHTQRERSVRNIRPAHLVCGEL